MEKIWLNSYEKGIPAEINPDSFSSLVDLFDKTCKKYAKNTAFSNYGTILTYEQLDQLCTAFAAYLQNELGMKKGQRFALMLPNVLQYPVALFGALRAGLVIVNVNPLYTVTELAHQMSNSSAEGIVILANFVQVLQEALPQTKLRHIIVTEIGDMFSFPKSCIANFIARHIKKMVPKVTIPGSHSLKDVLKKGKVKKFTPVQINNQDVAFLQYTGGTTGVSKGAMLSHRNLLANVEQIATWFKNRTHPGKEVIITALPLYHIFSLTGNCLTFLSLGGCNVLVTNPRDMHLFITELKRQSFTAITGVNTLFNSLLNAPEFSQLDFSKLHFAFGGGMTLHRSVAEKWRKITGTILSEGYGLTESSPVVTINPVDAEEYTGCIGLPIPSTDVKICDEDNREVALGEVGELWVKGPQVMQGYWNAPEETRAVLTEDGWLATGDLVSMDEKGFISIVDRKKDLIVVSGFNVYPNEIEAVISKHPGVLDVAVVGVECEISGEKVKAFIVKRDPALTVEDIIKACRHDLTAYKIPKEIEFRDELPKTNVGKHLRRELRASTSLQPQIKT